MMGVFCFPSPGAAWSASGAGGPKFLVRPQGPQSGARPDVGRWPYPRRAAACPPESAGTLSTAGRGGGQRAAGGFRKFGS